MTSRNSKVGQQGSDGVKQHFQSGFYRNRFKERGPTLTFMRPPKILPFAKLSTWMIDLASRIATRINPLCPLTGSQKCGKTFNRRDSRSYGILPRGIGCRIVQAKTLKFGGAGARRRSYQRRSGNRSIDDAQGAIPIPYGILARLSRTPWTACRRDVRLYFYLGRVVRCLLRCVVQYNIGEKVPAKVNQQ
ncbi:MAG: hypothetical protein QY326_03870 [Bdellovibrionota bacterium]|nr:MAG: hypothetical protein QY326_03870 [Bdellovibrionota bacterium]